MSSTISKTSLVIPAKNEAQSLEILIPAIQKECPELLEIIVVNDGSTDKTEEISRNLGTVVVNHKYSRGNGAAIKSGTRAAKGEYICFMDADGQHKAKSIKRLIDQAGEGVDMVVGARRKNSQAGIFRLMANLFYNWFASTITGFPIVDLTSGLRVVNRKRFMEFLYLLPNGFSYPTTITMAFLRSGYQVGYIYEEISPDRLGKSHISPIKDGLRFLIIIFKIGTLYSPLKVFTPISFSMFLTALSYYLFTFFSYGQLTNMSVILFTTSVIIFLIGLVSEQITALTYMKQEN
ncbi:MAG: glycosyltransferase family 2 protein [Kangiellaceae bacterium]|nr:glycosyltransferase family 2 protein [Kangiellaceae bacterium]MCW8997644.1 glycosyltransferase family 2 protein [Kangiellaceae bacterium]MCW9018415.1 glycosyltransferase family 2 protein [Kangiellaceae bacterium]